MTRDRYRRADSAIVMSATLTLIIASYLTFHFAYQTALVVQAALILLTVCAVIVYALSEISWKAPLTRHERRLAIGLGAYTLAALWGAVVAVASGNDIKYLMGQLFAMGILPAAAFGGLAIRSSGVWRGFRLGLLIGVSTAVIIHISFFLIAILSGQPALRLYLPNSISVAGSAPLAVFVAFSCWYSADSRLRRLGWIAVVLIVPYLLGTNIRSLWILMPVLTVVFFGLVRERPVLSGRLVFATLALLACLCASTVIAYRGSWFSVRECTGLPAVFERSVAGLPNWVTGGIQSEASESGLSLEWESLEAKRTFVAIRSFDVNPRDVLAIRIDGLRGASGEIVAALDWYDENGGYRSTTWLDPSPVTEKARSAQRLGSVPVGVRQLRVRVLTGGSQSVGWQQGVISIGVVEPRFLGLLTENVRYFVRRGRTIGRVFGSQGAESVPSLAMRRTETNTVMRAFRESPAWRKLVGHGLGSVYERPEKGRGDSQRTTATNYIHNFYGFLVFKLGVVGSILVAVALITWIAVPVWGSQHLEVQNERALLAAFAAGWLLYVVWGPICPEIIDFRNAAILGLVVASTASLLTEAT
jgi:hypothetical protein